MQRPVNLASAIRCHTYRRPKGMCVFRFAVLEHGLALSMAHIPEHTTRSLRAYGQSRGVMPFSCAYLAADASIRGRTSA